MATDSTTTGKHWTAAELRKLPPAERDVILEAAAAMAESVMIVQILSKAESISYRERSE